MRNTRGFIKIFRELIEEDIGQSSNFMLGLFVRILLQSNWKDSGVPLAGQRVMLHPGQLATGLAELSPDRGEDPYLHRVRNALEYLEKRGTITQATSNQGRVITVINWDSYQRQETMSASEPQAERKQSASEAQAERNINKNIRREEGKKKEKRRTRVRQTYSPEFERVWSAYGKEGSKSDAYELFQDIPLSEHSELLRAIDAYRSQCNAKNQFLKHMSTFLGEDWHAYLDKVPVVLTLDFGVRDSEATNA